MKRTYYRGYILRKHPIGVAICRPDINRDVILNVVLTLMQGFSYVDKKIDMEGKG